MKNTGEVKRKFDLKHGKNYIEINNAILNQGIYIACITNLNIIKSN